MKTQQFPKVTEEAKQKMKELYREAKDIMINLYCRWMDEKEYEDIKDYSIPLLPIIEKAGGKFIKMNKRPFGFVCSIDGISFQYQIARSAYEAKTLPL